MSNENVKGSGMMIKSTGEKEFDLDPVLDPEGDYEARIIGFIHTGLHQKDVFLKGKVVEGQKKEEEQAIVLFELTDEEAYVDRGPEDDRVKTRRIMPKFVKWSSHEKSNLFKIGLACGNGAAFVEDGEGHVDPVVMIGCAVNLKLGTNKAGDKNNVKDVLSIPPKYRDNVPSAEGPLFAYTVHDGSFIGNIKDVPVWLLNWAMENALDSETFGQAEAIEARIAEDKAEKEANENGKLEGDEKAQTTKTPKKEPEQEVEKAKEEAAPPRRSRRNRNQETKEVVDYSGKSMDDMEDILIAAGVTDAELNTIAGDNQSDSDYLAALITKAQA